MPSRRSLALAFVLVGLGICTLLAAKCSHVPESETRAPVAPEKTDRAEKTPEAAAKPAEPTKAPEHETKPAEVAKASEFETTISEKTVEAEASNNEGDMHEADNKPQPAAPTAPVVLKEPVKATTPVAAENPVQGVPSTVVDPTVATYTWDKGQRASFKMIHIPAGSFTMGGDDVPVAKRTKVTLTQSFSLGETEVTQALYEAVTGHNPSHFKSPQRPVEQVSWEDAVTFCEKLNAGLALPGGWKFALPTEAQWEYAARAGAAGNYGGAETMDEAGWYVDNSNQWPEADIFSGKKHWGTHEVAKKKPNAWGLYDMNGNVWEWCADWYVKDYKKDNNGDPLTDPTGPATGSYRVRRGGSWWDNALYSRNDYRDWFAPKFRRDHVGFRLALVKTAEKEN